MHTKYTSNIIHLNLHFVFMIEICFKIHVMTLSLSRSRVFPWVGIYFCESLSVPGNDCFKFLSRLSCNYYLSVLYIV